MVQIIEENEPLIKFYQFTCGHCRSILEAEENEVKHDYGDQRDEYHHISVECPKCRKVTGGHKENIKIVTREVPITKP